MSECGEAGLCLRVVLAVSNEHSDPTHLGRLLRARRKRPRSGRAAEQGDELAVDIDRAGQKIAGTVNDSITLCMKRILKQATIVELENNLAELSKALSNCDFVAGGSLIHLASFEQLIGANEQRQRHLDARRPWQVR